MPPKPASNNNQLYSEKVSGGVLIGVPLSDTQHAYLKMYAREKKLEIAEAARLLLTSALETLNSKERGQTRA